MSLKKIGLWLLVLLNGFASAQAQPWPMLLHLRSGEEQKLVDVSGMNVNVRLASGVETAVDERLGVVARFTGDKDNRLYLRSELLHRIGTPVTVSLWVNPETRTQHTCGFLTKRTQLWIPTPFTLGMRNNGELYLDGSNGNDGAGSFTTTGKHLPLNQWSHLAFTHQPDGEVVLYLNGERIAAKKMAAGFAHNDEPMVLGYEMAGGWQHGERSKFKGLIGDVRVYAAALPASAVTALYRGESPATRQARAQDFAPARQPVKLRLSRFGVPVGQRPADQTLFQAVERKTGDRAEDFIALWWNDRAVMGENGRMDAFIPLRSQPQNMSVFAGEDDERLQPGDHWFRATDWLWGRRFIYTAHRTARGSNNELEVWAFPVQIERGDTAKINQVSVSWKGHELFNKNGPWQSLTLWMPTGGDHPYELNVDGVRFEVQVGLEPYEPGQPRDVVRTFAEERNGIVVKAIAESPSITYMKAWQEDLAAVERVAAMSGANATASASAEALPLAARWTMAPRLDSELVEDTGPMRAHGELRDGAVFVEGRKGKAVKLNGKGATVRVAHGPALNPISENFTLAGWVRLDQMPVGGPATLVSKRAGWWQGTPFGLYISPGGHVGFDGFNGSNWFNTWSGGQAKIKAGQWHHVALTYAGGPGVEVFVDGHSVARSAHGKALANNDQPLVFGHEQGSDSVKRVPLSATLEDFHLLAEAVKADQIRQLMEGTSALRPAHELMSEPALPMPLTYTRQIRDMKDLLGLEVPRSPVMNFTLSLTHGMSGGHFMYAEHGPGNYNKGHRFANLTDAQGYAQFLAQQGYDLVVEQTRGGSLMKPTDRHSYDRLLAALSEHGVRGGLNLLFLQDSNLTFYTHNLPQWRMPLYRDTQLVAQRMARYPSYMGSMFGADNAGYVYFWDWSPPIPEKHWGRALQVMMGDSWEGKVPTLPTGPLRDYERPARNWADFVQYIGRYDRAFADYGYFQRALHEIDARLWVTTGSFGSSPGVGATGGWAWASMPGEAMFSGLDVLMAYDWNETQQTKPVHNIALLDRLRSYHPDKPAWALLDDFDIHQHGPAREREYALALTRGVQAVGSNWLPQDRGPQAKAEVAETQKRINQWVHRMGGAYVGAQPLATVGILYVHEQALMRRKPDDKARGEGVDRYGSIATITGPHEGKTTEALLLAMAAGFNARIITPAELRRGLPTSMKVILLTGLPAGDESWSWHQGLEPALQQFIQQGGRVLTDHESVAPVRATATDLRIRSYLMATTGGLHHFHHDVLSVLLERNRDNIAELRRVLGDVERGPAWSDEPTVWVVTHQTGDTQYVTVLNYGHEADKNPWQHVTEQTANLHWHTERPIYELHQGQLLSTNQVRQLPLAQRGFVMFALPREQVQTLAVRVDVATGSHDKVGEKAHAIVTSNAGDGLPVELQLVRQATGEQVTLYAGTGQLTKLPIHASMAGEYKLKARDLLAGIEAQTHFNLSANTTTQLGHNQALRQFMARSHTPLVLALTSTQMDDADWRDRVAQLKTWLESQGRSVTVQSIKPGEVVRGLQTHAAAQSYPRWRTIEADLILIGSPADNPLLLDQARGFLLREVAEVGRLQVTYSPFVGEYHALNLLMEAPEDWPALFDRLQQLR